ncbi:MAG TPA: ABC transporter ATP-binding protein [Pseudogracilibacillus sp.]|nr:ABC transporter ATP-binding protein [Pseudogracilibacillus sp.]
MKKTFSYLSSYKKVIAVIFLLVFIQALSQLFLPTLMGDIVDNGVVAGDVPYIWKIGFVMLLVTLAGVLVTVLSSYYTARVATGFSRDLREAIFTHVSKFTLNEFDKMGTASLITRTTNDVNQIQQATIMILRMVLMAPFMLVGGLIMALSKDAKLSMTILLVLPFIVGIIFLIMKKAMPLFQAVQKRLDQLNRVFRENLTGMNVIRAFTREPSERERLKKANFELMDVSIRVNKIMALASPTMMLFMNLTIVFVIWFGGFRIEGGNMEIGDLMAFIQYVMLIMSALIMASMIFVIIPRATVSANRIRDVLELERAKISEGNSSIDANQTELKFKNVYFHYQGSDESALTNISFTSKKGETTAIIGGTGSGKTTLVNLIPRFYEANSGEIYINQVNIKDTQIETLRNKIGLVPQKAMIFSGTVFENISYGKPNATLEEVKHAAKTAQAADFIESLEDGYNTYLEQGGSNLSGGQKQRLSIARALVRNPDIYIFDDSFSALDYRTDAKLRKALEPEIKESTVIIVGQRVSSVRNADQILVLDKGQIVGKGTHDELIKENEIYQEIVDSQFDEGELA